MEYIAHRINTVSELEKLDHKFGVELDLRDHVDGSIYIQHDPFVLGEDFEEYLKKYQHGTMILNIKSERIEFKVIELLKKYEIKSYFFLDSSFPMIKLLSDQGEKNIALRFSEFEGMDTIRNMAGKVDWIWIDNFERLSITEETYQELKELGYKLCLVSPELQGQDEKIEEYAKKLLEMGACLDSICTKIRNFGRWEFNLEDNKGMKER